MKKLISIIIPFFNSESSLANCLNSILKQTINNYEIILIDNSSTDSSTAIALSYSNKYKFIHYYNIKERNASIARNTGLKNAHGDLICFIDSDDTVNKNYLKILYEHANNNDLVMCSFTRTKHKLNDKIKSIKKVDQQLAYTLILKHKKIRGYIWNKLFKANIIKKNNLTFNKNLIIGEDIDFVFNYLYYTSKIIFIDSNLYYYHMNESNTTNNINNYQYTLESWTNMFNKYKKFNNSQNLDLINYYYLKKYYELKYYQKNIQKNNKLYFSNKLNLHYHAKLFIYKNLTPIIILLKKVRNKL